MSQTIKLAQARKIIASTLRARTARCWPRDHWAVSVEVVVGRGGAVAAAGAGSAGTGGAGTGSAGTGGAGTGGAGTGGAGTNGAGVAGVGEWAGTPPGADSAAMGAGTAETAPWAGAA